MLELFEPSFGGITPRARTRVAFRLGLLAVVFALAPTAFAQHSLYRFDHWTTDSGLPQNTVYNVIQTRDGYLWLTTFDGLARFDGVRFTVFDKSNSKGINSNRFMALYEASDGTLLIGTEDADCPEVVHHYDVSPAKSRAQHFLSSPARQSERDGQPSKKMRADQ